MKKELKVFVVDLDAVWKLLDDMGNNTPDEADDETFIRATKEYGEVYTLNAFTLAFNEGEFNLDKDCMRFIEVEPEKPILNDIFEDWSKIFKR